MCFGHPPRKSSSTSNNNNNNARRRHAVSSPVSRAHDPHNPMTPSGTVGQTWDKPPATPEPSMSDSQTPAEPPPPFTACAEEPDPPPPPVISHDTSPTSNAHTNLADSGYTFCRQNPLVPPQQLTTVSLREISRGALTLIIPPYNTYRNHLEVSQNPKTSLPIVSSTPNCPDTTLLSSRPLYAAGYHHPANTHLPKRIYFEIRILSLPPRVQDAAVAIGFAVKPYPHFRLPGWHRGSIGVHGDDGRRYCDDSYGGNDFVEGGWAVGERVGIGMSFGTGPVGTRGGEVWFTRNEERAGGWWLDEEVDSARDRDPTFGLDGGWDVYAALGIWGGGVQVEVLKFESA
ncbi:unnamed protein product [Tuber aestivum]|uniref:SPRY domain-containing protein n=1 Tax=Tuber aestivum TaxID=59557 RepID=A0A292Q796_9PEZI|nr:unnamed protein product [Tuber aestivum]